MLNRTRRPLRAFARCFRRSQLDKETADYLRALKQMQGDAAIEARVRDLARGKISVGELREWLSEYEAKRIGG